MLREVKIKHKYITFSMSITEKDFEIWNLFVSHVKKKGITASKGVLLLIRQFITDTDMSTVTDTEPKEENDVVEDVMISDEIDEIDHEKEQDEQEQDEQDDVNNNNISNKNKVENG